MSEHMQIGEVAQATGLSLRTIRHYEEVGLVLPTARSKGGFRLYTDQDVERLRLVRAMKPLDFSLEETRDLLEVLDALAAGTDVPLRQDALLDRLAMYRMAAVERVRALGEQLAAAEGMADHLQSAIDRHASGSPRPAGRPAGRALGDDR